SRPGVLSTGSQRDEGADREQDLRKELNRFRTEHLLSPHTPSIKNGGRRIAPPPSSTALERNEGLLAALAVRVDAGAGVDHDASVAFFDELLPTLAALWHALVLAALAEGVLAELSRFLAHAEHGIAAQRDFVRE